ncbi:MAG: ActS/PrrB/RegB family redox-sensitive histidine kinase [Celeribacter sp.]|jgi:two-component system sensor histidine kinase RegB
MAEQIQSVFDQFARSNLIRLRTLIVLRWIAIAGQIGAIFVAIHFYDLQLDLGLCYLAIGAAVISNLVSVFIYPANKRLSDTEAALALLFDVGQLSVLVFLSGGLNNPFALLILAPVTIAASTLRLRSMILLSGAAIGFVTVVLFVFVPLRTGDGLMLAMPDVFRFGFWVAIVIGIAFLAGYARRVSKERQSMSEALLATQMALAREQKLTDLGGVVAAAAHELGTPLATIKLVSSELIEELDGNDALRDDALLIREQADRCRDILHSMGRAGKDDLHMRRAPLDSVLREAAEPHGTRGKTLVFDVAPAVAAPPRQPDIFRRPEIIHGLRNMIQNAVDFADTTVWIEARWTNDAITIRIADDGAGYPPDVIGRIGDPFVRNRRRAEADRNKRPEYEGMGLGLFIAKTLLERSGATLTFANGSNPFVSPEERPARRGAIVEAVWPRSALAGSEDPADRALGANEPIDM